MATSRLFVPEGLGEPPELARPRLAQVREHVPRVERLLRGPEQVIDVEVVPRIRMKLGHRNDLTRSTMDIAVVAELYGDARDSPLCAASDQRETVLLLIPTVRKEIRAPDADPRGIGMSVHALQVPFVVLGQRFPGHEVSVLDDNRCGERGPRHTHDLNDAVPIVGCAEIGWIETRRTEADRGLRQVDPLDSAVEHPRHLPKQPSEALPHLRVPPPRHPTLGCRFRTIVG